MSASRDQVAVGAGIVRQPGGSAPAPGGALVGGSGYVGNSTAMPASISVAAYGPFSLDFALVTQKQFRWRESTRSGRRCGLRGCHQVSRTKHPVRGAEAAGFLLKKAVQAATRAELNASGVNFMIVNKCI